MLNKSGKSGHPCLVPNLCGNAFSFSTLRMMLPVGLSYIYIYILYYVEVGSLYDHFLESFYQKLVLNFVKSFFCIYLDDHIVFILQFVDVVYHTDWLDMEESLHPWNKFHLIMVYDPFNVLLRFGLLRIWGFLHLPSLMILACSFLLLWYLLFWYLGDDDLIEWGWECSFLCNFFGEEFHQNRC